MNVALIMYEMTLCNVNGVACSDEVTENSNSTQRTAHQNHNKQLNTALSAAQTGGLKGL